MPCKCGSTIVAIRIKKDSAEATCAKCGETRVSATEERVIGDLLKQGVEVIVLDDPKKAEDVHDALSRIFGED